MPIRGGKFITSGSGDQFIATPFAADIVMLLYNNNSVQDTWESLPGALGMGYVHRDLGAGPGSFSSTEEWSGNQASSSFLWDVAVWMRTGTSSGPALFSISFENDGFWLRYSGGFSGGAGNPLYWMAIGDEDLSLAKASWTESSTDFDCGFEPTFLFGTGSGSFASGTGSITFADYSLPTWGAASFNDGAWSENIAHMLNDDSTNNYFYQYGDRSGPPRAYFGWADAIKIGHSIALTRLFSFSVSGTHVQCGLEGPIFGFLGEHGRLATIISNKMLGFNGMFTPSDVIGEDVIVETPIDIEGIVFFGNSPQDHQLDGDFNGYYGGSSFGYVTKNGEMAVTAAGGRRPLSTTRFQSDQCAWVSNFTLPMGGVGNQGTAEILGNSFKVTTTANGKNATPVGYMALGFEPEAPGFFRVVYR